MLPYKNQRQRSDYLRRMVALDIWPPQSRFGHSLYGPRVTDHGSTCGNLNTTVILKVQDNARSITSTSK